MLFLINQALRTVPYISHKTGSVYQCAGIVSGYVNSVEIDEFFKSSETNNPCVEDYLKLEDKIGIISSPRGRVLFGPANVWNKGTFMPGKICSGLYLLQFF